MFSLLTHRVYHPYDMFRTWHWYGDDYIYLNVALTIPVRGMKFHAYENVDGKVVIGGFRNTHLSLAVDKEYNLV